MDGLPGVHTLTGERAAPPQKAGGFAEYREARTRDVGAPFSFPAYGSPAGSAGAVDSWKFCLYLSPTPFILSPVSLRGGECVAQQEYRLFSEGLESGDPAPEIVHAGIE